MNVYRLSETCPVEATVAFDAPTRNACWRWLQAKGGDVWKYQKANILHLILQMGLEETKIFQEGLQDDATAVYHKALSDGICMESLAETCALLEEWSYLNFQVIEYEHQKEMALVHSLRRQMEQNKGFQSRQPRPRSLKKRQARAAKQRSLTKRSR